MTTQEPVLETTVAKLIKKLQALDPEVQVELREDYVDEDSITYVLFINKLINLIP
jgi:hypothetical protein